MEKPRLVEIAETLFDLSKELEPTDDLISQLVLFTADRVLKKFETQPVVCPEPIGVGISEPINVCPEPIGDPASQPVNVCPDCGGHPNVPDGMEICEDCGGTKPIGEACQPVQTPQLKVVDSDGDGYPDTCIDEQNMCHGHTDPGATMCNGHMADGSGVNPDVVPMGGVPITTPPSKEDQEAVSSMVEKIRNELKGK
jgi:hypothetical protein